VKKPTKKLQQLWDRKLAKAGFEDAEDRDNGMLKKWHDPYWRLRFTPESFEERRRYFELATDWLNNGTFETGRHKTAWAHHCEGLSYRDIAKLMKTNYDVIMALVQRCQREAGLRPHDID
jgi:hypothetical protein